MSRLPLLCLPLCAVIALSCDDAPPDPPPDPPAVDGLITVANTEPAWLGVWGDGPVIFLAGGTADAGRIARIAGDALTYEDTPDGPHLWWVFGTDPDHVWAVGAGGRILRRGPDASWVAETTDAPDDTVLWGVWGSSATDLWAVGGTDRSAGPRGVVLRSSGDGQWTRVVDTMLPLEDPADEFAGLNLYKVWGTGPDDVHLVGEGGIALRWNGAAFARVETETREILFTVHGRAEGPILAVGGLSESVVRRFDGTAWVDDGAPAAVPLNGVFVRPDGSAWVSGARGVLMYRSAAGAWTRIAASADAGFGARTLHAVWAEEAIWSVGGDLTALRDGVIATTQRPALMVP